MIVLRTLAAAAALLLSTGRRTPPAPATPLPAGAPRWRFADGAADCPAMRVAQLGPDLYWCSKDCTMNVHFPGGAPPVTLRCDIHATTHGNAVEIELYAVGGGPGAELRDTVHFDVRSSRDGAALAGASFAGDEVWASALADATRREYQASCGNHEGRATVTIGPAVATQQSAEPVPTRWWTLHGSASATLVECVPEGQVGGTAVVEASF